MKKNELAGKEAVPHIDVLRDFPAYVQV